MLNEEQFLKEKKRILKLLEDAKSKPSQQAETDSINLAIGKISEITYENKQSKKSLLVRTASDSFFFSYTLVDEIIRFGKNM